MVAGHIEFCFLRDSHKTEVIRSHLNKSVYLPFETALKLASSGTLRLSRLYSGRRRAPSTLTVVPGIFLAPENHSVLRTRPASASPRQPPQKSLGRPLGEGERRQPEAQLGVSAAWAQRSRGPWRRRGSPGPAGRLPPLPRRRQGCAGPGPRRRAARQPRARRPNLPAKATSPPVSPSCPERPARPPSRMPRQSGLPARAGSARAPPRRACPLVTSGSPDGRLTCRRQRPRDGRSGTRAEAAARPPASASVGLGGLCGWHSRPWSLVAFSPHRSLLVRRRNAAVRHRSPPRAASGCPAWPSAHGRRPELWVHGFQEGYHLNKGFLKHESGNHWTHRDFVLWTRSSCGPWTESRLLGETAGGTAEAVTEQHEARQDSDPCRQQVRRVVCSVRAEKERRARCWPVHGKLD